MKADYDRAVREHQIDLLYVDAEMAGVIEMIVGDDHLYIENVAVAPAFRGRGLGRRLLVHAEQVAARNGLAEIRLRTNATFTRNTELYRRCGYSVSHTTPFMGGAVVHMRKPLR